MRRSGCVGAAIVVAVTGACVRAAAVDRAAGPDWFWSFLEIDPEPGRRGADWVWSYPDPKTNPHKRGPEWFWSYSEAERQKARRRAQRSVTFSGADLWRHGAFLYGGTLWAPGGLDRDGLALKAVGTRGVYRYRAGMLADAEVAGALYAASVMPGARFTRGGVSVGVYAGLDFQTHILWPDDPGSTVRGRNIGVRMAIDLWCQPTREILTTASATLSTIGGAHAARAAFGWRLHGRLFAGPEAAVYGASDYRQFRLGAHVTGFDVAWFELQAALGYAWDDDGRGGGYARFGVSQRW